MYPGLDIFFFNCDASMLFLITTQRLLRSRYILLEKKIVKNLLSSKSHAALLIKMKKVAPFKKSYNHDS